MSEAGRIIGIDPAAAITGGEIAIECADFDTSLLRKCRVLFDGVEGQLVGISKRRALVLVPEMDYSGEVEVVLEGARGRTNSSRLIVGTKLAEDLHPVANPAFDPEDGSLYVTRSGSRGQQMPVSIFRIDADGELTPYSGEITNPTGIAFNSSGEMYVTSRMDGTVYRISNFKEVIPFASDLGIATGIAFDGSGRMYVGDRSGTIYRVNGIGEAVPWAHLEPSVAAYHLAFGPDGALYVTGPTVSSYESVMRIDKDGEASVFYRGLGRPQGLAFDREGNLYVAASMKGRRGIIRISSDGGQAEMAVGGMNIVGLAFSPSGDMIVATNDALYSLAVGIQGTLLN